MNITRLILIGSMVVLSLGGNGINAAAQVESPNPATSVETNYLQWAGSWPYGPSQVITVDTARHLVFISSGGAVLVFDVSNPAIPAKVSDQIITQGEVLDLAYDPATQRLYIAANESGFEIWDVSVPASPLRLSSIEVYYFDVEVPVEGVEVVGNYAYVATNWGYVHWLDVSDPYNPIDEGFNGLGGNPTIGITTNGNQIFTCGVNFVEFSIQPNGSLSLVDYLEGYCTKPYASGDYAYADFNGDLYVIDISSPILYVVGSYAVNDALNDFVISGTTGYLLYQHASQPGVMILDMSNPPIPSLLGTLILPGIGGGLWVENNIAYIADLGYGLQIADVSNPAAPFIIGSFGVVGATADTRIVGNRAYLASANRLQILDITERDKPVLLGEAFSNDILHDVAIQGDYAYVADWTGGLRIFNISNSANPVEVGGDDAYDVWLVDVQGNWAYTVEWLLNVSCVLHVYDVSNPATPVEAGSLTLPQFLYEIKARGDYVYIADYDNGFRIIDVSDPNNPQAAAIYSVPHVADFSLKNDLAFVAAADWDGGLIVLDISNPVNPTLVVRYNPTGWFHPDRAEVAGDYLYMADYSNDIYLFDVSNPANPVELESQTLSGYLSKITASGPYVYISDGNAGMPIYRNSLINLYNAAFESDSVLGTLPGQDVVHDFLLTNLGVTDSYTLTISDFTWETTLLTNSPITIQAGESMTVSVMVSIPAMLESTIIATDGFTLTAQSHGEPGVSAVAYGTTNAEVDLNFDLLPSTQQMTGAPGDTLIYTLTISNTGNYSDTYNLSMGGHEWPASCPDQVGPMDSGATETFQVSVSLPSLPGDIQDTFYVTATSQLDALIWKSASGTSSVMANPSLLLSGVQSGDGKLGEQVRYTVALTNTGEYSDTFSLSTDGIWPSSLSASQVGPLGAGGSVSFYLDVFIPASVQDGDMDTTTVIAASGWDPAIVAQTQATTRAVASLVYNFVPLIVR